MKAVYLLFCLALARFTAGHIFRRHQQMEMNVEPLDYIDQQQPLYQQRREQPYTQSEQYQQPEQYQQQNQQYVPKTSEEYTQQQQQEYRPRQQHHNQQHRSRNPHKRQQTEQNVQYNQQYQHQTEQQYQRQPEQQQEQRYQQQYQREQERDVAHQSSDSTSNESNSVEKERMNEFAAPLFADYAPMAADLRKRIEPAFGDVIAWKGIEIAAGPKNPIKKEDIEEIFKDAYDTIYHISEDKKTVLHEAYEAAEKADQEDGRFNATQLLNKYQYQSEEHVIKTDDGYFLTLFRIQPKEPTLVQKPVVFLMHGLLGSADDWLLMGPGKSLAYLLADAGYEVWLGNARGSKYSRRHVSKHPAQSDFWQFGTDEIALHDLPAMIDYALKTSKQEKLYYVGYSQGTTAYFALASTRPEYNEKIIMMYALSPMVYMTNVRSPMLRMISPKSKFYTRLHDELGHGQFKPSKELVHTLGGDMCQDEIRCNHVCSNVNYVMSGVNVAGQDVELIPVILGHLPAGASTRQIKQYAQAVASQEFTKYDFGSEMNEKVYGTNQPPKYEMEKVTAPVVLYYSEDDWMVHPRDVERLAKELPNVKDTFKVPEEHFSHMDFQFSRNAPEVVYKRLIESIQMRQNEKDVY